nr:type I-E CRISPR-associated protein Cas7/Cse4/CasC [uncultured Caldimonas sp.]
MNKNFVNIHVLISHSPSCLNRDDMNMQKTAVFGGVRRVRVSSQSLKRAMRTSDYYRNHLGTSSIRTRQLGKLRDTLLAALSDKFPAELVSKTLELISGKEGLAENTHGDAVAPWSIAEFSRLCELVQRNESSGADSKKLEKLVSQEAASLRQAMAENIDIALSGRMATSGLMSSVDGAMAVAHAITTHAAESDIDWFTAVDDLVAESGESGAGHLDTQEFSAGVFYRYASVNLRQLQDNLGGASRGRALEVAAHALHLMATVVPSAKQQSFAAHNPADFAMVSLADQPISLANAFENPVKNSGGFLRPSVNELLGYWEKVHRGYGLDETAAAFDMSGSSEATEIAHKATLPDLEKWLLSDASA